MDVVTFLSYLGTWTIGSFTAIDLIAATTNAFNGAVLATRRDHFKNWTVVGIILLAVFGGIGGGVTRDVILNSVPSALTNPWYLILCTLAAALALAVTKNRAPQQVRRIFDFMAAFSLPWYATIGAQKALDLNLPVIAVILIGMIGPTAGRYFIDITSGVTPQHFVRGEWWITTAALTAGLYVILYVLGLTIWPATLIAWAFGFAFRLAALHFKWEEPEPWQKELGAGSETAMAATAGR
jgi:uncharacterized membrane protein YeiH